MPLTHQAKRSDTKINKNPDPKAGPVASETTRTPAEVSANPTALAHPLTSGPNEILHLQRQYGNRATRRLIQRSQAEIQRGQSTGREGGEVSAEVQSQIDSARGGGQPLDKNVGAQVGEALGANLNGVRVHTDSKAKTLNKSLTARAFTTGSDIFFSKGAYSPGTGTGKQLLAHELTHVVQQGAAGAGRAGAQRAIIQRDFDPDEVLALDGWMADAWRLKRTIRAALMEVFPDDDEFVDNFMKFNVLVKDILAGTETGVPLGRVVYAARVSHQKRAMFQEQTKPAPQMALGYTKVPEFSPEQIDILKKFHGDENAKLSKQEKAALKLKPKPGDSHELDDFTQSLGGKNASWYKQWVGQGLVSQQEYDTGLIAWQVAFDKATHNLAVQGGAIHFDLTGFLPEEVKKLKQAAYYLPYAHEPGKKQSGKTFQDKHPSKKVDPTGKTGSSLMAGLRITHWELAQILYNKNLWERTTFYKYDKGAKTSAEMQEDELQEMGIEFMGNAKDTSFSM